jgi:ribosomal protein L37E
VDEDLKITCKRCGLYKYRKARGLCETCWKVARLTGFEHYPTKSEIEPSLVCQCHNPIREAIALWDVVQCKRCGKKVVTGKGRKRQ